MRLSDGSIALRPFRDDDLDAYAECCADPESISWGTRPAGPDARAIAREVIKHARAGAADGSRDVYVVEVDGALAGRVSLRYDGVGGAELGYETHPACRGRGLAERACRLLCTFGFTDREVAVIRWHAFTGNWASRRIAWKLGFSFEATSRRSIAQGGELRDGWGATLLAGEPMQPRRRWLTAPRLAGSGVVLRELRDDDVERIVEGAGDPLIRRWLPFLPDPYGPAEAREFLETTRLDAASGSDVTWAMADPGDDRLIGCLGVDLERPEIGYWAHPAGRGRGLTTEAVRLALGYCFSHEVGANRMTLRAGVDNTPSRRVAERAGMRLVGMLRAGETLSDGVVDVALYDTLRDDHA